MSKRSTVKFALLSYYILLIIFNNIHPEVTAGIGRSGVRIPVEAEEFSFFSRTFQTSCGSHPASHSMGTGTFFVGVQWPWREVATHLRLAPTFSMTGAIPVPFLHPRVRNLPAYSKLPSIIIWKISTRVSFHKRRVPLLKVFIRMEVRFECAVGGVRHPQHT
jgi:hypothetical protein